MTLAPSTRLGPYQITASIGQGGMGEVYRARDTRLDRTVAIKVVGQALASVDDRASLEQEGRAIAALNHPHICALYDIGEHDDRSFLVMEYVAGETLAARLARGPLPVREVIRYAIQIAEALDHAHRHGIVHRDLKPANIVLTDRGVKVLDFGLATLRAAAPLQLPLEATPIAARTFVSERILLGTVQYMAPERLEGCDADAAADLFSFGAMLYEMAAGQRPFESNSPAGVIAAILRSDPPPPSTLRAELSPSIDWVIQKALAKNPEARWRAAGDLVEVLRWIARGPEPASIAATRRRWLLPVGAVAVIAGVAALLALAPPFRVPPAPATSLAFSISPPDGGGFTATPSSVRTAQFALSPNGRRLVFVASVGHEASQLWVRELDALRANPLPGTQGAEYPFWSPDSESIGFFANGSLKRVDPGGGPARVLAPASDGRGGAWSRQGLILFSPDTQSGLFRIPAGGGSPTPVTRVDAARHETSHRWPQFLADDRHFIYFVQATQPADHGIYLGDLEGAASRRLVTSGMSAVYVAPDRLLYVSAGALFAARFDWEREARIGEPATIVSAVAGSSNFSAAVSVSQTGLLAYTSNAATSELMWVDRTGARVSTLGQPAEYADFRVSPDGQQLAVAEVDGQSYHPDIRVLDLTRGAKLRLTADEATDAGAVWSPDGKRIVFRSNRGGRHDLYQAAANGSGTRTLLLATEDPKYPTDWFPDGRRIVYHTFRDSTGADIWLVNPDGSDAKPLLQTPFDEMQGQISPDGEWLAYASLESGQAEVYVRSLVDAGSRWQVSAGGGTDPRWRGNGRELFYVSADSWLTMVAFANGAPSAPKRLFEVRTAPAVQPYMSNYNVTRDAERFLVKVPVHDVASTPIHIVTNWMSMKRGT